jgi:hypothetical protein
MEDSAKFKLICGWGNIVGVLVLVAACGSGANKEDKCMCIEGMSK